MSSTFYAQVQEIFADALEHPRDERSAYLDRVCAGKPELREEVEALLAAHDEAGEYLAEPTISENIPDGSMTQAAQEAPGTEIDRYVLRERIGEGGFGVVYRAEQVEPVRREVALKIIKRGMDTRQVVTRFEAERQTLAVMDHPGIARVLDAGTTPDGRPYFVMDLVRGQPIVDFCDRQQLSIVDRLRLFRDVCAAVQYAHQKGVIHRDLKPSNILVSMVNDEPLVKIIDFGIAKAIDAAAKDQSLRTMEGQFIGTPEYMSPEQAGLRGTQADIDTRTDIYSLGVLLYQLLTGTLPFDPATLRNSDLFEIRRRIREIDPPKPSTRLRRMDETNSTAAAVSRGVEERALIRRLRGDLDWITMKAMAKERALRYASANELSDDVQRHLAGEPVLARPPSVRYRTGKFIRRNKVPVAAAAAVLLVLVGGIIATSFSMLEAQRQRDAAQRLAYRTSIAAASAALEVNDSERAVRNLDEAPTSLRGWEWRHLRTRTEQSLRTFDDHDGVVRCVTWSPDGTWILSGGSDGVIHVRDITTDKSLHRITTSAQSVVHCAIDPTGRLLLVHQRYGKGDAARHEVVMRDLITGDALWRRENALAGNQAFSSDGTTIGIALRDERAVAWIDARSGRVITRQPVGRDCLSTAMTATEAIACLTRGPSVYGDIEVVQRDGSRVVHDVQSVFSRPVFSPSRDRVLWSAWTAGSVNVGNVRDGSIRVIPERSGHERWPLAVSPDGRWAALSEGRNVLLWDMSQWEVADTLTGHSEPVSSAAFSKQGDRLVTGDQTGELRTWVVPPTPSPWIVKRWETWSRDAAALSTDGTTLATVGWSFVRLWDLPSGTIRRIFNERSLYVQRVAFSPDDQFIAVAGRNNPLHVLNVSTGEVVLETNHEGNQPLAWAADGESLLWLDAQGEINIIDVRSGHVRDTLQFSQAPIRRLTITDDNLTALAWSEQSQTTYQDTASAFLLVWNLQTSELEQQIPLHGAPPTQLSIHHDGQLAAIAHTDGRITLWDLYHGRRLWDVMHEGESINGIAFSRDATRLAVARVGRVDLLNTTNGHRQVTFRHHVGDVVGLAFTPDDAAMVVCGQTHPMTIYDAVQPDRATIRARSAMVQGRRIADPLFDQLHARDPVLTHLRQQGNLSHWQREAAIDYARARGDHLAALASAAVFAIERGRYEKALRCYQTIQQYRETTAPRWDSLVAVAHYFLGEYEKAHAALQRYINWPKRETDLVVTERALLALIEQALGNQDKAMDVWRRARQLLAESEISPPTDRISQAVLREARSVFDPDSNSP